MTFNSIVKSWCNKVNDIERLKKEIEVFKEQQKEQKIGSTCSKCGKFIEGGLYYAIQHYAECYTEQEQKFNFLDVCDKIGISDSEEVWNNLKPKRNDSSENK